MPDLTSLFVDHVYSTLNQTEKITVSLLQTLKSHVVRYKKNGQDQPLFSRFLGLNYLLIFMFFPVYLFYWCYLYPVYYVCAKLLVYLRLPIKILRRRSRLFNALISHTMEIFSIAELILQKILTSKISELLAFCISTAIEISLAMIWPFQQQVQVPAVVPMQKPASVRDMSELVDYEELSPDDAVNAAALSRKSTRIMHNYIPSNPFRATVRIKKSAASSSTQGSTLVEHQKPKQYQRTKNSATPRDPAPLRSPPSASRTVVRLLRFLKRLPSSMIALVLQEASPTLATSLSSAKLSPLEDSKSENVLVPDIDIFNIDSPASFPSSPFSRAYVMNRASERVVSLMFAARDRLRLEAQSVSRDEFSRMVAREAQTRGQFAVFDARQVSAGIALTCGNHCAVKVGKGLVSSCRAMIPIRPNTFVYFEFSVTVSSNQVPHLAIGLAPLDSPLNVMVGSWAKSVGLYYDGQVMIGSRWFPPLSHGRQRTDRGGSKTITDGSQGTAVASSEAVAINATERISAGSTVGILIYLPGSHEFPSTVHDFHHPELACPPPTIQQSRDRSLSAASNPSRSRTVSMAAATAMQLSHPLVHFNINGQPIRYSDDVQEALKDLNNHGDLLPHAPVLFPTVSLFTEETRVWCRFCEADIVYRDRAAIRAPPGARVYCLDGSLLLSERE